MYENTSVGVVVPAYNEAPFIGEVVESVPPFVDRCYVVDDCSTDDTWAVLTDHVDRERPAPVIEADGGLGELAGAGINQGNTGRAGLAVSGATEIEGTVVPIRHVRNRGHGGAVKTGYQMALVEWIDVIAVMDGDGQMDLQVLDRIIDPVVNGEADYAKGNRLVGPDHWAAMSRWRQFGNVVPSGLTKVASGYWRMRDPQNGYTAIPAAALRDIGVDHLYEDYDLLNDVLVRCSVHGKRVGDMPVEASYDEEESGIEYRSFIPKLLWLLSRLFLRRLWTVYGLDETGSRSVRPAD